jgi:hypothetical protein
VVGKVTEKVARSPTAPAIGVKLFTRTSAVYSGVDAERAVPFAAMTVTVPIVPTRSSRRFEIAPAPKSEWKSSDTEPALQAPDYLSPAVRAEVGCVHLSCVDYNLCSELHLR